MIYDNLIELFTRNQDDILSKPTRKARVYRAYQYFCANAIPVGVDYDSVKSMIEAAFEDRKLRSTDADQDEFFQWFYRFVE